MRTRLLARHWQLPSTPSARRCVRTASFLSRPRLPPNRNLRRCPISAVDAVHQDRAFRMAAESERREMPVGDDAPAVDHDGSVVKGEKGGLRYCDIGINLGDPIFRGIYHGKQAHEDDFDGVLQRARDAGCRKMMVTGSDLKESEHAVEIAKSYPGLCYATVGVHPCSATQFDDHPGGAPALLSSLRTLATSAKAAGHAVAFGEIGLDYDRLYLAPKETQLTTFAAQLDLALDLQLPLFLHSRAAAEDFENLLTTKLGPGLEKLPPRGLVHSFTGTVDEMQRLVALGLDIGINGCSLKTEENLDVVRAVPLERIQIETDGPWCEIRPSHASSKFLNMGEPPVMPKAVKKERWVEGAMVKGRNEPCAIPLVAHVIAGVKEVEVGVVCEAAWNNSIKMFGLGEKA